jgi:hypothetical protein
VLLVWKLCLYISPAGVDSTMDSIGGSNSGFGACEVCWQICTRQFMDQLIKEHGVEKLRTCLHRVCFCRHPAATVQQQARRRVAMLAQQISR